MAKRYIAETLEAGDSKAPRGRYRTVRVLEVEIVRVVHEWPACFAGATERSALGRAQHEAEALVSILNREAPPPGRTRSGTYAITHARSRSRKSG